MWAEERFWKRANAGLVSNTIYHYRIISSDAGPGRRAELLQKRFNVVPSRYQKIRQFAHNSVACIFGSIS